LGLNTLIGTVINIDKPVNQYSKKHNPSSDIDINRIRLSPRRDNNDNLTREISITALRNTSHFTQYGRPSLSRDIGPTHTGPGNRLWSNLRSIEEAKLTRWQDIPAKVHLPQSLRTFHLV
jgi:hypothetical protein